jgi:hypothetical protein
MQAKVKRTPNDRRGQRSGWRGFDALLIHTTIDNEFRRLPGLFRRWELKDVVEAGPDFHFEEAGTTADGSSLFATYRRDRAADPGAQEDTE